MILNLLLHLRLSLHSKTFQSIHQQKEYLFTQLFKFTKISKLKLMIYPSPSSYTASPLPLDDSS